MRERRAYQEGITVSTESTVGSDIIIFKGNKISSFLLDI